MISRIRTFASELKCGSAFRIAFALLPNHGSDREVAWTTLEADKAAKRSVTYITSPSDFRKISELYPFKIKNDKNGIIKIDTIKIISWPLEIPNFLVPVGFVRYFAWTLSLQLFVNIIYNRQERKKIHFLTYTQLATPVIFSRQHHLFLGPVGIIPRIPKKAPVSFKLKLKSLIMWRIIMPFVKYTWRNRSIRTAVVHSSLLAELNETSNHTVLSALNTDYFNDQEEKEGDAFIKYDAIVVARNVSFKNLEKVIESFRIASDSYDLRCLIVDASKPKEHHEILGNTVEIGRQNRDKIADLLKASKLHVMLSVELGGYINLEAAKFGLPTLCLDGFGASEMLKPSEPFILSIYELEAETIAKRILDIVSDNELMISESGKQKINANNFISTNKAKFKSWLEETVSS